MKKHLNLAVKNLSNIPGWNTKRKLVVIEADDWGAIRTRSKKARDLLIQDGCDLSKNRFNYFDTLANAQDLQILFGCLKQFKDAKGNHPVFSACAVMGNPDFNRMRAENFEEYHYEDFRQTLNSYFGSNQVLNLWKEGIDEGIFIPEFHGREHLNSELWLKGLKANDTQLMQCFNQESIGWKSEILSGYQNGYMAAFDFDTVESLANQKNKINEGLAIFSNTFGYDAKHFTASSLIHSPKIEEHLHSSGISYIDVAKKQIQPLGGGKYQTKYFKLGESNNFNQTYITRNCQFEPNSPNKKDWVSSVLNDIKIAFRWNKPAIISTHRVNFVGGIEPGNRKEGILQLETMLSEILKNWPDVEFISVSELGRLINA